MHKRNLWYDLRIKVRDEVAWSINDHVLWSVRSDIMDSLILSNSIPVDVERELLDE